jgi:hypothetical protein
LHESMKLFMTAVVIGLALGTAPAASAAGSLPPAAAPPAGMPVASTLQDALIAIERASASNPAAAQSARFIYNAALEQYNAHEFEQARASALMAISRSAAPPAAFAPARAPLASPAFPGPNYFIIPDELPATPANAQRYVALAHRAMASCPLPIAAADFRGAVSALKAKQYRAAMADSRNTVDDCASR